MIKLLALLTLLLQLTPFKAMADGQDLWQIVRERKSDLVCMSQASTVTPLRSLMAIYGRLLNEQVIKDKRSLQTLISQIEIDSIRKAALKKLKSADLGELLLLGDIVDLKEMNAHHFQEILKGAHLKIDDNGQLYEKWSKLSDAIARTSSHHSLEDQHGITGDFATHILFGVDKDSQGRLMSWCQLERTPADKSIVNTIKHLADYFNYKITGKNIGPYGESNFKDSNPLVLK